MPEFNAILAIDSAMNGCGAGVWAQGGKIAAARSMAMERGQAEALVPLVEDVMREAGMSYDELDMIAATVGPGTFTGLRVGLSAAKAMGLALGIPVAGITTLDVIARQFYEEHKSACAVLIETKREDFYFQMFGADGKAISKAEAISGAEAAKRIAGKDLVLAGDAVGRFSPFAPGMKAVEIALPDPLALCRMAAEGLGGAAEPVYLRAPDTTTSKTPQRRLAGSE